MGEGAGDAGRVDAAGFAQGGEGRFEGERVRVEPVEEGCFAEDADVGILGGVDVGVYIFAGSSVT